MCVRKMEYKDWICLDHLLQERRHRPVILILLFMDVKTC